MTRLTPGGGIQKLEDQVSQDVGRNTGQLNPDWVCWLMGWPIGWTSLEPMTELLWLDWSVDPADMKESDFFTTACKDDTGLRKNKYAQGGSALSFQVRNKEGGAGPIPRIATGIKDRVNRLKAIGNGQVPQCVEVAWKVLSNF